METVQRLDVGRWLLDNPVHVAAHISLGRGIRALPSKSYLAPPMDERDRAAGAMGQLCAALHRQFRDQSTEMPDNFEQHCSPRESEP